MQTTRWHAVLTKGFVLAGLVNVLGMLAVSQAFTNQALVDADPGVFSTFGQIMIVIWGLAYLGTAKNFAAVPWLCAAFFVEKMAYVVAWCCWWMQHADQFDELMATSPITGVFIAGYGANDLAFGVMFLAAWRLSLAPRKAS